MTDPIRAPGEAILFADGAVPAVGHVTWNQIARLGEYRGHRQGAFAFTRETFADLIANFSAVENGRIPVDYEHTSEVLPENAAQEGVPAVAWIVALEERNGSLWAAFEWVDPQAVEYVRNRQYLFVSPAVKFAAVDKRSGDEIGARLTSVALTNHPFLDGMAPLRADGREPSPTRLGLAPGDVHIPVGTTPRKERPAMTEEDKKAADEAAAAKKMADDAMCSDAGKYRAMAPKMKALMSDMGEATEDGLLDALAKIVESVRAAQKAEAATMADRAVARGLVAKEGREDLVALCLSDRPRFDRMYPAASLAAEDVAPVGVVPTADAKVLLSERLVDQQRPPVEKPANYDGEDPMAEARAADNLAERLLKDGKAKTYGEAVLMASREVRQTRVAHALQNLPARAAR